MAVSPISGGPDGVDDRPAQLSRRLKIWTRERPLETCRGCGQALQSGQRQTMLRADRRSRWLEPGRRRRRSGRRSSSVPSLNRGRTASNTAPPTFPPTFLEIDVDPGRAGSLKLSAMVGLRWDTQASNPSASTTYRHLASLLAMPTTRRPRSLASWPTPEAAETTAV